MPKQTHHQRGFTIVEMIVVFSILAILAVIAAKTYTTVYNKAKIARVETAINEIDAALQRFKAGNNGFYPGLGPWPVNLSGGGGFPRSVYYTGPMIVGGSPAPIDDPSNQMQAPYYGAPGSPFGDPAFTGSFPDYLVNPTISGSSIKPIDALVVSGALKTGKYPENPFRPGHSMVNVAYTLGRYDRTTNSFSLVELPAIQIQEENGGLQSVSPRGISVGRPDVGPNGQLNPIYKYSLQGKHWSVQSLAPGELADLYPEGEFGYIPLGFKDPTGRLATDYWLIGYGSLATRDHGPYNEWLLANPTMPDFPPPMGDNNRNNLTLFEQTLRKMLYGAQIVKGSKYVDQLNSYTN